MAHQIAETLGDRLQEGDDAAFENCYRQLAPLVSAYVRRFVPADEAEDLVQVTFFELWRARHRYDPSRSLPAFVLAIARDRAIDHLRRRRHTVVDMETMRNLVGDDGKDLVDRLAFAAEVRQALQKLRPSQREAIELSYFAEMTQVEIADALGVPLGTVKARMARGMKRLASLVGGGSGVHG